MTDKLDGLTILRFSHTFRRGGGVEEHLNNLDHILLTRNKVKIIRMYLAEELKGGGKANRRIAQGSLVEIPMPVSVSAMQSHSNKLKQPKTSFLKIIFRALIVYNPYKQSKLSFLKVKFRELIVYNPFLYYVFFRQFLRRYYPRPGAFEVINAGEVARRIFQEYNVDLLVMHYVGGVDSAEIIEEAKKLGIPYIFINHFANDSFINISVREQISDAAGIAGVTGIGIPKRIKNHFYNVSNGIDLEIFNPVRTRPLGVETNIPTIIYPARIIPNKGQKDLINAYISLRSNGFRARIVFAGRTDSVEYEEELRGLVRRNGLSDDVLFLGQLNTEELRDWYGVSSIMAFPTYHQEGLPRILMEAQAMKVPPVAYIIGGTPEALQDGKTGFLVRKGDIKTFTRRLRELLINEERRKKMGEEGREFVKKQFSLEALAERHEKLYLSVLKKLTVHG